MQKIQLHKVNMNQYQNTTPIKNTHLLLNPAVTHFCSGFSHTCMVVAEILNPEAVWGNAANNAVIINNFPQLST